MNEYFIMASITLVVIVAIRSLGEYLESRNNPGLPKMKNPPAPPEREYIEYECSTEFLRRKGMLAQDKNKFEITGDFGSIDLANLLQEYAIQQIRYNHYIERCIKKGLTQDQIFNLEKAFSKKPWNFCETPEENCTMNYCDDNGCQNRKRNLVKKDE